MNKLHYILIITLLAFSNSAIALLDDIEGAFGIKFGEMLDVKHKAKCKIKTVVEECEVIPPKPYSSFTSYQVVLTPHTNKVFRILGNRYMNDFSLCIHEAETIIGILKKKHAIKMRKNGTNLLSDTPRTTWDSFKDNKTLLDKGILISCDTVSKKQNNMPNVQISIRSFDGSTKIKEIKKVLEQT